MNGGEEYRHIQAGGGPGCHEWNDEADCSDGGGSHHDGKQTCVEGENRFVVSDDARVCPERREGKDMLLPVHI